MDNEEKCCAVNFCAFSFHKNGTQHMVKSLELVETVPLLPGMKIK